MLKIGIVGTGHLGKIHIKCLTALKEHYEITGFHDPDPEKQKIIAEEFGIHFYDTVENLIRAVDVLDVVAPTIAHFDLVVQGLQMGKHVFCEKPVTETLDQAHKLLELAMQVGVNVQIGHVERYNPAFIAAIRADPEPMFIEGHRLAQFNPRGTDVSVVHDLMIHDIDILVALIHHPVVNVQASGVAIISDRPDICNARLEFANGAVANLTASRVSLKNMRKLRMFQPNAYISVDFLEKQTEIIQLSDTQPLDTPGALEMEVGDKKRWISMEVPEITPNNAILEELKSFHHSIVNGTIPDVTLADAVTSMEIAQQIHDAINESTRKAKV